MYPVQPISVSALSNGIKRVLQQSLSSKFWLWGEINSMSVKGGHCYIDLVEKDTKSDAMVAKIRCNIWQWNWRLIEEKFRMATGQQIVAGLTVQLLVQVEYHELYSISVSASDIDPNYTLGAIQRRRIQIIDSLRSRGLLSLNKRHTMPTIIQRIAVISSPQAAGYTDFCHQLTANVYGFAYHIQLFQAVMQGTNTEPSVISAMQQVAARASEFDIVVVIRGGGATSDLYAFDSLPIAETCARMTLPVVTGIGHQRDESILDMVAHTALKTPTAVAEYIIARTKTAADRIDFLANHLHQTVLMRLSTAHSILNATSVRLPAAISSLIQTHTHRLHSTVATLRFSVSNLVTIHTTYLAKTSTRITSDIQYLLQKDNSRLNTIAKLLSLSIPARISSDRARLELIATKIQLLDPKRLLARGYSMTLCRGHIVSDITQLKPDDILTTHFAQGKVDSKVIDINLSE